MSLPNNNPFRNEPNIIKDIKRIMEGWVQGSAEDFLNENTISEGGVKGAIEDFMYDTLPQAAVKELQPVFKNKSIRGSQLRDKVSTILKKHKIPTFFMGTSATQVVIDNFETYFGESVEEAYAHPDEKTVGEFYEKTGKKAFEYRMSQDSWGKSHGYPHEVCVSRKDYKSKGDWRAANVKATVCYIVTDEGEGGKPVVEKWDITKHIKYVKVEGVEADGEVLDEAEWGGGFQSSADAHREVQAGLKADFQRERAQKLKLIVQVIRGEISKQKFKKLTGSNYDELMKNSPYFRNQVKRMPKKALEPVAKKEEVEVNELTNLRTYNNAYPNTMIASSKEMDEEFKAGDTVKVPHKGKIVKGKIVRFDNGGTSKAQQHGGGYVVDVGEPASILVPKHNVRKN
jgi:hypothetical protein